MNKRVSFILSLLNEYRHINRVIKSIKKYSSCFYAYMKSIVVDNGSINDTVLIAQTSGAITYCIPGLSVGALKNFGASKAKYDYLVFQDADVYLTPMWQERILQASDRLTENVYVIAGSICGISGNPSTIESCWLGKSKEKNKINYINSGHMIVQRQVFQKPGGFDEQLKTGED